MSLHVTLNHRVATTLALATFSYLFVISKRSASFILCEDCSDVPSYNSTRTMQEQGQQVRWVKWECCGHFVRHQSWAAGCLRMHGTSTLSPFDSETCLSLFEPIIAARRSFSPRTRHVEGGKVCIMLRYLFSSTPHSLSSQSSRFCTALATSRCAVIPSRIAPFSPPL